MMASSEELDDRRQTCDGQLGLATERDVVEKINAPEDGSILVPDRCATNGYWAARCRRGPG